MLFLALVTHSDLLNIGQLDWKGQRDRVWAQIKLIFAALEIWALQEQAASMADDAKKQLDCATSTIKDNNIAIDTAISDMTEAQADMAKAYEMMKQASASIERFNAASRGIHDFVKSLHYAYDRAQGNKEHAERSFKTIELLKSKADTLIQKYGDPKSNGKSLMGGLTSHPSSTKPDEIVERKNSNLSIDDATAEYETSADNAGFKKNVGLAT
jgi:prefoldin subunit 5